MKDAGATAPGPIVVAGMHRSGTSLAAQLLDALGVAMGPALIPADADNAHGYCEDAEIVEFNRRVLAAAVDGRLPGWPDWGWTEPESWREPERARWLPEARALLARRAQPGHPWGWKDPRNTMLLDLWAEAAPEARFVFVYRVPWGVADSMQRLRHGVFRRHPGFAHAIWRAYNRRLLDFHRRHRERCVLVSADALVDNPGALAPLLAARCGLEVPPDATRRLEAVVVKEDFQATTGPEPLARLLRATHPKSMALLDELDAAADLRAEREEPLSLRLTAAGVSAGEPPCAIVVPCRDHGEFLVEALASAERHAPDGAELVVVDDGSTETRTREILAAVAGLGYRVLRLPAGGLPAARNAGIAATRAAIILPLDADNRLLAGYVEGARAIFARDAAVGVVYGDRVEFGAARGRVWLRDFTTAELLRLPRIDACALFRREVWVQTGGYDPRLRMWEDWEFWIHARRLGWKLAHLPAAGFAYRVREDSLCRNDLDRRTVRKRFERFYARHGDFIRRELAGAETASAYVAQALRDHGWPPPGSVDWLKAWLRRQTWWHRIRPLLRR